MAGENISLIELSLRSTQSLNRTHRESKEREIQIHLEAHKHVRTYGEKGLRGVGQKSVNHCSNYSQMKSISGGPVFRRERRGLMDRLVTGDDGNDNIDDDDDDDEDDGDNDDGGDENDDDDDHDDDDVWVMMVVVNKICIFSIVYYSRTPVTRTLKGNEKQFELLLNSSYQSKFQ